MENNDKIILYSTGCPKCRILEAKLKEKNINYTEVDDIEYMKTIGLKEVPWLKIDNDMLNFADAVKWVNNQ